MWKPPPERLSRAGMFLFSYVVQKYSGWVIQIANLKKMNEQQANNDYYPWAMIRLSAEKQELNLRPSPTVNAGDALPK